MMQNHNIIHIWENIRLPVLWFTSDLCEGGVGPGSVHWRRTRRFSQCVSSSFYIKLVGIDSISAQTKFLLKMHGRNIKIVYFQHITIIFVTYIMQEQNNRVSKSSHGKQNIHHWTHLFMLSTVVSPPLAKLRFNTQVTVFKLISNAGSWLKKRKLKYFNMKQVIHLTSHWNMQIKHAYKKKKNLWQCQRIMQAEISVKTYLLQNHMIMFSLRFRKIKTTTNCNWDNEHLFRFYGCLNLNFHLIHFQREFPIDAVCVHVEFALKYRKS